jgi:hypothetical protein
MVTQGSLKALSRQHQLNVNEADLVKEMQD